MRGPELKKAALYIMYKLMSDIEDGCICLGKPSADITLL